MSKWAMGGSQLREMKQLQLHSRILFQSFRFKSFIESQLPSSLFGLFLLFLFKISLFYFPLPCKGPCIATCITAADFEIPCHTGSRHLYSHMCSENIYGQLLLRLDSYAIKSLQYPSHVLLLSLAQGKNSATGYNQQRQGLCSSA